MLQPCLPKPDFAVAIRASSPASLADVLQAVGATACGSRKTAAFPAWLRARRPVGFARAEPVGLGTEPASAGLRKAYPAKLDRNAGKVHRGASGITCCSKERNQDLARQFTASDADRESELRAVSKEIRIWHVIYCCGCGWGVQNYALLFLKEIRVWHVILGGLNYVCFEST